MLHRTTNHSARGRAETPVSNVLIGTKRLLSKMRKSFCFKVLSGRLFLVAITSTRTRLDDAWSVISDERVSGGGPSWAMPTERLLSTDNTITSRKARGFSFKWDKPLRFRWFVDHRKCPLINTYPEFLFTASQLARLSLPVWLRCE
jgi:hypothetical protein